MEVIKYSHKEIPPSRKLQSFLLYKYELGGGFCGSRVSFGSAQLLQCVCIFFHVAFFILLNKGACKAKVSLPNP